MSLRHRIVARAVRRTCRAARVVAGVGFGGAIMAAWTPIILAVYLHMVIHSEGVPEDEQTSRGKT